jgi:hypothetical protein
MARRKDAGPKERGRDTSGAGQSHPLIIEARRRKSVKHYSRRGIP